MKIVVTGGSGLVGRAVVAEALAQGHDVRNADLTAPGESGAPYFATDVRDYDTLVAAIHGFDALVHMAAHPNPLHHPDHVTHNDNVVGSYNVLRAAAEVGIKRVCLASSSNAIGLSFSRKPRFDYFPIDERHPCYTEDPYSLSKWICEQQADAFARRYADMRIASLRFHMVVGDRAAALRHYGADDARASKHLWAYVRADAVAQACLLSLAAPFTGHECFNIVAPATVRDDSTRDLAARWYPQVPIHGGLTGSSGFFDCSKAERVLGWRHAAD